MVFAKKNTKKIFFFFSEDKLDSLFLKISLFSKDLCFSFFFFTLPYMILACSIRLEASLIKIIQ